MKRFYAFLFVFSLVMGFAIAAHAFTPQLIPSPGIKYWESDPTQLYGKVGYMDNGNCFRYVLNSSGSYFGPNYPTWYKVSATNDYTVTTYEGNATAFAGIAWCKYNGATSWETGTYGWIQIAGYATASVEGTVAIVQGDSLIGSAGHNYLVHYAPIAAGISCEAALKTRAVGAWSTASVTYEPMVLRSRY